MIALPTPHPAFSPSNPFLQIAWDATSLELFMRDPYTYYCTIIEGWRTPLPSAALLFGSLYHESCGLYCFHRLNDLPHDDALDHALAHAIVAAALGEAVPGDPSGSISLEELSATSMRRGDRAARDTYRLLRAIVWWCDLYGDDPMYQTIALPSGRPAIEVHFDFPLGFKLGDDDARLCGHLDGIVRAETGELLVREWKHTTATIGGDRTSAARYFLRYKPNVQINTYALAGRLLLPNEPVRGVLIEACQTATTFAHFEREWIDRPASALDEWHECVEYHVRRASALADQAAALAAEGGDPARAYARAQCPPGMRQYGASIFADAAFRLPNLRRPYLTSRAVQSERWNPTAARDITE